MMLELANLTAAYGQAVALENASLEVVHVTMTCPDAVAKDGPFTCTVTGPQGKAADVQMDDATRERLRALGYVQ